MVILPREWSIISGYIYFTLLFLPNLKERHERSNLPSVSSILLSVESPFLSVCFRAIPGYLSSSMSCLSEEGAEIDKTAHIVSFPHSFVISTQ